MENFAVIIAQNFGSLQEVAEQGGYEIVEGTERQYDTLTTFSDPRSTAAGVIDTERGGWVALAQARA